MTLVLYRPFTIPQQQPPTFLNTLKISLQTVKKWTKTRLKNGRNKVKNFFTKLVRPDDVQDLRIDPTNVPTLRKREDNYAVLTAALKRKEDALGVIGGEKEKAEKSCKDGILLILTVTYGPLMTIGAVGLVSAAFGDKECHQFAAHIVSSVAFFVSYAAITTLVDLITYRFVYDAIIMLKSLRQRTVKVELSLLEHQEVAKTVQKRFRSTFEATEIENTLEDLIGRAKILRGSLTWLPKKFITFLMIIVWFGGLLWGGFFIWISLYNPCGAKISHHRHHHH